MLTGTGHLPRTQPAVRYVECVDVELPERIPLDRLRSAGHPSPAKPGEGRLRAGYDCRTHLRATVAEP